MHVQNIQSMALHPITVFLFFSSISSFWDEPGGKCGFAFTFASKLLISLFSIQLNSPFKPVIFYNYSYSFLAIIWLPEPVNFQMIINFQD